MNIGILGGGQLGWMTILEGRKFGFNFFVLDENPHAPASKVADGWFPPEKVEEFSELCDVITYEFEHIEDSVIENLKGQVLPSLDVLKIKKNRGSEKNFLLKAGYPVPKFEVCKLENLEECVRKVGLPAVVKAEKLGYDGKGQYRVSSLNDLKSISKNHPEGESFVVEEMVHFRAEISAVGVRDKKGRIGVFPVTQNVHEEGILLYNWTPKEEEVPNDVVSVVSDLMEDLSVVGLLAVEFFLTEEGKILINEFAPRPHNTGHYTLDGAYTSQFENLTRAITGLPLGSTRLKAPSGMVNILGLSLEDIDVEDILSVEGAKLYWYGKEKRERRKMGHVNVVAEDHETLKLNLQEVLRIIYQRDASTFSPRGIYYK